MFSSEGYVYLLHFEQPICPTRTTQHYLGWCQDLARRIQSHERGRGARLTAVAKERAIAFSVVRVWPGGRTLERKLKNRKDSPALCPVCREAIQPGLFELTADQINDQLIPF